ncbi:uncharacterized protein Triagg1_7572 [Trichoderma aggressivum f. europaeum]|uniref:HNH nuclease domain-containing protein n=1 Tax=Trichoderma aggressivum f. europaeum TaxID=173218 RepID=A0AAE1M2M6_9HYPO|nr:hypothetical protein Triagg1_7572 [Trichoderma aggressivum f. europaeum]
MEASPEPATTPAPPPPPRSTLTPGSGVSPHTRGSPNVAPPELVAVRVAFRKARRLSMQLQREYTSLKHKVEPDLEPDQQKPEPDLVATLELANLGIEKALRKKKTIQLERQVFELEEALGLILHEEAKRRSQSNNQRHFSNGEDLWRYRKKANLTGTGVVRALDPRPNTFSEGVLSLYADHDGLTKRKSRPNNWRRDVVLYYDGLAKDDAESAAAPKPQDDVEPRVKGNRKKKGRTSSLPPTKDVWCHISAMYHSTKHITAAHIVPFFLDVGSLGELLFGNRAESLSKAGNSLLLHDKLEGWFDKYLMVIVPVDAKEVPITRWRSDIIDKSTLKEIFHAPLKGADIHRKELTFLNEKRPVSRFLYFHFIMSLIRVRHEKCYGWEITWAEYYDQRPFPSPGNYMRQSMLMALATHFETADIQVIDSWISDHGFETPLKMTDEEIEEAARRVHKAVEDVVRSAEQQERSKIEDRG